MIYILFQKHLDGLIEMLFIAKVHVTVEKSQVCCSFMIIHVVVLAIIILILVINKLCFSKLLAFVPFYILGVHNFLLRF